MKPSASHLEEINQTVLAPGPKELTSLCGPHHSLPSVERGPYQLAFFSPSNIRTPHRTSSRLSAQPCSDEGV